MHNHTSPLDILITGGTLLTMDADMTVIENARIGICQDKIVFVEKNDAATDRNDKTREVIDATGCLIMPGLVNTHTHAAMVGFRGIADDLPLMTWLQEHIFPLEKKYVSREMVYACTLLAVVEMIQSGTTTFCDGYFFPGQVAKAAIAAGIRTVPCLGFFDLDNPDGDPEKVAQHVKTAERYLSKWQGTSSLVFPGFFPHSPYLCCPQTMQAVKEVARQAKIPFVTHLSETREETNLIMDRYGLSPVRHMEAIGVLDERTVAVHCNWPDDEDIRILAEHHVRVSHNPESGMKLAAGLAPVPKLHAQGVVVGLGTDGCASNNDHDLFGEMDTAAKAHKLVAMDPTVMDARTVVKMATIDGARVLGLEGLIGSIETGKYADIILLDLNKPRLTPLYNPYSQIVYAATGDDVTTTIVQGKILMKNGKLTTVSLPEVMEDVRRIAGRIQAGD